MGHRHGTRRGMAQGVRDEPGGHPCVVVGHGASCCQGCIGTCGWGLCIEAMEHSWVGGP